jgi:hypothetical protein
MFEHNIFDLLKEFSDKEIKKMESFLKSPYHNKNNKVILLFSEIRKYYPLFNSRNLTKEKLSKKVNPDIKYNDSTLRNLMSVLLKCIEEFLIMEELNKNKPEKRLMLSKSYLEKNQDILFEKNSKEISKLLETGGRDSVYYYNKSLLDVQNLNFNLINKTQKSPKIILSNQEIRISYAVNVFIHYITELINTYIKIRINETKFNHGKKKNFLQILVEKTDLEQLSDLLKSESNEYFIVELYSNLLLAYQNLNSGKNFKKYKDFFFKYINRLSRDEISYHYSMLISYCILSNSLDDSKNNYDTELLKIYESFLKGKFYSDNKSNVIDEELYKNILRLAFRLKRFKWALTFITVYSKYLHPGKKENIIKLSYAEYYFYLGSHLKSKKILNESFEYIKEIREESFLLKYDVKSIYLMLYYDLQYDDSLINQINNYRKFLNRNKLVTKEKKANLNIFLNALEKLVTMREGNLRMNISDLKSESDKLKNNNYRNWLLEKSKELRKLIN